MTRNLDPGRFGPLKLLAGAIVCGLAAASGAAETGLFTGQGDVGTVAAAGSVKFDPAAQTYEVTGEGNNMWFTNDDFHFVWQRRSGDFSFESAVEWLREGGNPHRKACLVVRQSLEPGSAYIDVALHGDGLVSLQYRETAGGMTREIQARPAPAAGGAATWPVRAALTRQGDTFFASLAPDGAGLRPAGAFQRLKLVDPVYVGLGVCAHGDERLETARFSAVKLVSGRAAAGTPVRHCALETISIGSRDRRVVYHSTNHMEAPNWSRDGDSLVFNSGGRIYRLPVTGGEPAVIDTGTAQRCNNDHGLSPNGRELAISDQHRDGASLIYVLPAAGGTPRLVTPQGPSYWHGWSPDGATLAYCAQRQGEFDIYTIPAAGGEEKRLTTAKGLDDGPDYSPDGKYIYFNSDRTGTMQVWRMKADGSEQEQVTRDEYNNWFPHPSPDSKWIVYLAYEKGVAGHPPDKTVWLRIMPANGGPAQDLARLFGGQGTLNVPSWSPDSRQLAFVSYELLAP